MPDTLTTIAELEALYGQPVEAATVKEVDRITPHYRAYIEASPFATLGTSGPEGLDCSPRGDKPGFVRVHDEKTLIGSQGTILLQVQAVVQFVSECEARFTAGSWRVVGQA